MSKFKTNEEFFDFSKRLVVIPIEDLVQLLTKHEIRIPLYVHRFLLKETIRTNVFEEKLYKTYTDELQYRLRGYDYFSIFLLEKMIENYNLDFDLARYKELLLNFLYVNKELLQVKNNFLKDLEQLQHNYAVDLEVMKYQNFMNVFKGVFYSAKGYIDGIRMDHWDEEMITSYTLGDLKNLGQKYGVSIPRRINKGRLVDILAAKFQLNADEAELLNNKSVLELEIYAKEKGFKISIDLKKTDMIEYLKFGLDMYHTEIHEDKFDYNIPLSSAAEEIEEDIIADVQVEELVDEEVEDIYIPEEIADEVEEEVIIEEVEEEIIPEEVEEEEELEEEEEVIEEPIVVKEEPKKEKVEPKKVKEEPKQEPAEEPVEEVVPTITEEPTLADSNLLSPEEKELLDEKINLIIKRYYKKRKRRRVIWTIVIVLLVAIIGFAAYSYIYYSNNNVLPFNIPVFW